MKDLHLEIIQFVSVIPDLSTYSDHELSKSEIEHSNIMIVINVQ